MAKLTIQQAVDIARQDPDTTFASALRKKIESGGLDVAAQIQGFDLSKFGRPTQGTQGNQFDVDTEDRNFAQKTRDFGVNIIGGGKLAEGVGGAIAAPKLQESLSQAQQANSQIALNLTNRIVEKKATGEDTSRLQRALDDLKQTSISLQDSQSDFVESLPSNKEVIGSATRLAGSLVAPSILGGVSKGGVAFQKTADLSGGIAAKLGGSGVGVVQGAKQGAKIGAVGGAIEGGIQGAGLALEDNGGFGDVVKGVGSGAVFGTLVGGAGGAVIGGVTGKMKSIQKFKEQTEDLIKNNPDSRVAKFTLDGKGKIVNDIQAKEAIKQGVDEGTVATVKGSSAGDKVRMNKAVDILEKGQTNKKFAALNRPSDVIGDSVIDRFNVVKEANSQALNQLDDVAKSLKGKTADPSPAVTAFIEDLDSLDIKFANGKPIFKGSTIEGIKPAENLVKKVTNRMKEVSDDAFELHKLKRFLDEQVTFGKVGEGVSGQTERVIKGLRSNIDSILDSNFTQYNQVNTKYSTTRTAIENFISAAGSKFDINAPGAEKQLGTLSRRVLSNTQSRVQIVNQLQELQDVAELFGGKFDDDIISQIVFVDELERLFGSSAPTSLQGVTEKTISKGSSVARKLKDTQGIFDLALEATGAAIEKTRGVNEDNLIKSIRALLK